MIMSPVKSRHQKIRHQSRTKIIFVFDVGTSHSGKRPGLGPGQGFRLLNNFNVLSLLLSHHQEAILLGLSLNRCPKVTPSSTHCPGRCPNRDVTSSLNNGLPRPFIVFVVPGTAPSLSQSLSLYLTAG